jgi:hypothetical protein
MHFFIVLLCTNMAHTEVESAYCSGVFMNSEVKGKIFTCEMCKECEVQLQETRDELNSMIMVNKLLQKELLLHTSTESIGTISLGPNVNKGHSRINAPMDTNNYHIKEGQSTRT